MVLRTGTEIGLLEKIQKADDSGNVRAVARAISILKAFDGPHLLSLSEISSACDLDKGTTRRLLLTLMDGGLIAQDKETKQYGLGRALRHLAANAVDDFDLRAVCTPIARELASRYDLTVILAIYQAGAAVCIERVRGTHGLEFRWWSVGGTLPANCGAAPKVLLAYQKDPEIQRVLSGPLAAMTTKSIIDSDDLNMDLHRIRERGYEISIDEVALGISAVGVPILDDAGSIVCAISISTLTATLLNEDPPRLLTPLLDAKSLIRQRLGYRVDK